MQERLLELLKNSDVEVRRRAVESLRGSTGGSAVVVLVEAMKDESWRVRKTATDILLQSFPVREYIEGVISLLYLDDNAGARNSAIDLLIAAGRDAIPFLIDAFATSNHDVRKFIIDVIGEISDQRALPLLLGALKDEDENVKASAVEHLGRLKEPSVVDALIEILQGDDLWTAYPAADALGKICDRRAIPALLKALENKTLREPALRALASFADPDTLDSIVPLVVSGSRSVKEEALRTLSAFYRKGVDEEVMADRLQVHLGDRALDILLKFAWSSRADIRLAAILMLGLLRDLDAVQPLLDMSAEEDFRDEIRRALVFIGRAHPEYMISIFDGLSTSHKRFIAEVAVGTGRREFMPLFRTLLKDDDGHLRALASRGIAAAGDPALAAILLPLLGDEYDDVQEAAVDAIVALREGIETEMLYRGLSDSNAAVRKNSALVLGRLGIAEAVPEIGFLVKDAVVPVRKAAVRALSMIASPSTVRHIMIALTDEVPDIRVAAAYALGEVQGPGTLDALVLLLSDPDDSVRVAAAKALGMHPDERAFDALQEALGDRNGFVVAAVLETIGRMGTEKAREAVISMLDSEDDEIRRTAISALYGYSGITEIVSPYLRHPDWATRKISVEVIASSGDPAVRTLLGEMYDVEEDVTVRKAIEDALHADRS